MKSIKKVSFALLALIFGVILVIGCQILKEIVTQLLPQPINYVISTIVYIAVSLLLIWVLSKFIFSTPFKDFEFSLKKVSVKFWILGIVLPIITNCVLYLINISNGKIVVGSLDHPINTAFMSIFGIAISAGITEELIFRGFLYTTIKNKVGIKSAIILPSVLFAALHLLNGHLNFASFIMLLISGTGVGIMFTSIRIFSGSIWPGVVVHTLWDFLIANSDNPYFTIAPASEAKDTFIAFVIKQGNLLLTGGEFGIEVSLPAIILYVAVSVTIYMKIKNNPNMHGELTR